MRLQAAALGGACVLVFLCSGCGGSSYSGGSSPTPTPPAGGGGSAGTVVAIQGQRGNQSFSPNPAPLVASTMSVAWRNDDNTVHRLVANDGSFDTGTISPGATSAAITIAAAGTNYHCTIHPTMVGAVSGTSGTTPPCSGLYCSQSR